MSLGYVRPARPSDAEEIARIQLSTWRTAYRTLLPRTILAGLDEAWMAGEWREAITAPPSERHRVLVAVEQPGGSGSSAQPAAGGSASPAQLTQPDERYVAGFAAIGPGDEAALAPQEPGLPATVAAVTDLLVEPRWGRRGHGSRLLAAAVELWRADGFTEAVAWAYDADAATVKFLESAGWARDGAARALDVDDLLVNQVRLRTRLA